MIHTAHFRVVKKPNDHYWRIQRVVGEAWDWVRDELGYPLTFLSAEQAERQAVVALREEGQGWELWEEVEYEPS